MLREIDRGLHSGVEIFCIGVFIFYWNFSLKFFGKNCTVVFLFLSHAHFLGLPNFFQYSNFIIETFS
jgi:hypothetical protein